MRREIGNSQRGWRRGCSIVLGLLAWLSAGTGDRAIALRHLSDSWQTETIADLVVVEPDVTQPVPDTAPLRQYDLHVALMYDRTRQWCGERELRQKLWWYYASDGGDRTLGMFPLTCRQAQRVVRRYDLQPNVPSGGITQQSPRRRRRWRRFVERSHPLGDLEALPPLRSPTISWEEPAIARRKRLQYITEN